MLCRATRGGCFMPEIDFYKTLGVSQNASAEEIRKAYKKLVQYHPDVRPGEKTLRTSSKRSSKPIRSWAMPKARAVRPLRPGVRRGPSARIARHGPAVRMERMPSI